MVAAAEREGDAGALTALKGQAEACRGLDLPAYQATLARRATLVREWQLFFERYPLLLTPVSAELPFADGLDMQGEAAYRRVWEAQLTQIGLPFMGLPGLAVAMGAAGDAPVGVQLLAARYREDILLDAGQAIERPGRRWAWPSPGRASQPPRRCARAIRRAAPTYGRCPSAPGPRRCVSRSGARLPRQNPWFCRAGWPAY